MPEATEVTGLAPGLAEIEAAARRLADQAVVTPLLEHPDLDERVGGRVELTNAPDGGTQAILALPLAKQDEEHD